MVLENLSNSTTRQDVDALPDARILNCGLADDAGCLVALDTITRSPVRHLLDHLRPLPCQRQGAATDQRTILFF